MKKKYTSIDIARLAGVSQSTVSRALSPGNAWRISPGMREKILTLCKKYGYFPKRSGEKIYHKTYKVGFLLGDMGKDLTSTSFSTFLRDLCDFLQTSSYTMTLIRVGSNQQKITSEVKRILKSNIADIYIAGDSILYGQTLELLHAVNTRLIRFTPFNAPVRELQSYHGISHVEYDYIPAYDEAAKIIPEDAYSSMIYLGYGDVTDEVKYDALQKMITRHHVTESKIPYFTQQDPGSVIWDQTYRKNRLLIERIWQEIKGKKYYWVGCLLLAQALSDHMQSLGLVPDQDFFIITYGVFGKINGLSGTSPDPFSVIGYHAGTTAEIMGELAMELLEDPSPHKAMIPVTFQPSAALGGKELKYFI
jgi:DNA-binding LacI/PurR family transcriptional regulator